MDIEFDNERPIYIQLIERIREDIVLGKYSLGSRIPSVREYALELKINPNTVQKALTELEKEKLIVCDSTNGRNITSDKKVVDNAKEKLVKCKVEEYVSNMKNIGVSLDESIKYLKKYGGIK